MDRRAFIGTAAVSALMLTSRANAQRAKTLPRVALVFINMPVAEVTDHRLSRAFVDGLRDLGLVEGRNIVIERRSAEGRYERFPGLMQELLALPVDVIVTSGPGVDAARRATNTIPIVIVGLGAIENPEAMGAASFARPGGNLTGLSSNVGLAMNGKRLQLLSEAAPKASRVAFLGLGRPGWLPETKAAAHALGLVLLEASADTPQELEAAFAAIARDRADALFLVDTGVNYVHARQINEYAARLRLPNIHYWREGPEAGGLMSYGTNFADLWRHAATFVDKILKGAKPGELPIEQPTKFELVINLKTAKALGLTIPQSLLLRADEVIQ